MLQEGSAAQGAASDADSAASTEPPCPAVASAHCLPQGQSIIPGVLHRLQCAAHPADEQQLNTASSCSQDLLERDAPLLLLGLSEPPRQAATPHVACLTSGNPTCTSAGGQAISGTGHMLDRLPSTEMHPGAQPVRAEGPQVNVPAAVAARCVGTNDSGSMISADDAQSNEIPRHQSGSHAGVAGLQAYVALVPYSRTPSPCDATTTIRSAEPHRREQGKAQFSPQASLELCHTSADPRSVEAAGPHASVPWIPCSRAATPDDNCAPISDHAEGKTAEVAGLHTATPLATYSGTSSPKDSATAVSDSAAPCDGNQGPAQPTSPRDSTDTVSDNAAPCRGNLGPAQLLSSLQPSARTVIPAMHAIGPVASVPAEASPRVPSRMRYSATARKTAAMASSRVDRMVACEALFTDEDTPEMSHMDNLVPERPGVSSRKRHAKEAGVASQTRSVMPEQPEQAVPKAWVAPMEPLGKGTFAIGIFARYELQRPTPSCKPFALAP